MSSKTYEIDGVGPVVVTKRASSRSLRLSIKPTGQITISIPRWASFASGHAFAVQKADWIRAQKPSIELLVPGQAVGKFHHIISLPTDVSAPKATVTKTTITVRYPKGLDFSDAAVQTAAAAAAQRALKKQAEQLLPGRLAELAQKHNCSYQDLRIKRLTSRWGSCDQKQRIVLNSYLMQLPWDLIDYVILHELAHTKVMNHGPEFWAVLTAMLPDAAQKRKVMRRQKPVLQSGAVPVQ